MSVRAELRLRRRNVERFEREQREQAAGSRLQAGAELEMHALGGLTEVEPI